jgi:predicted DNA-binding WGR domain protein
MPDPASTIQRTLLLRRVDPEHGMARFYMLNIERDLFGTVRLVRTWGRIGTRGRELADVHETEAAAGKAMEALAARKRRRGYCDL